MKLDIPADSIGFLIADIGRLMRAAFAKALTDSVLTFAEARTLMYVARFEGARQVELADFAEVQPMTMARLIDTLVGHGLVERRSDPADRRAFRIFLCDAAEAELMRFKQCGLQIQQQALVGLECDTVKRLLKQLHSNLQQAESSRQE